MRELLDGGTRRWSHINGLDLVDPEFVKRNSIEFLLGVDVYAGIIQPGLRRERPDKPIAQQTQLGWLILDSVGSECTTSLATTLQCIPFDELTALIRRFWEQEEPTRPVLPFSAEDCQCEVHYEDGPRSTRSNKENTKNLGKNIFISQHSLLLARYTFPSDVQYLRWPVYSKNR